MHSVNNEIKFYIIQSVSAWNSDIRLSNELKNKVTLNYTNYHLIN
jgi:hypothetical protein